MKLKGSFHIPHNAKPKIIRMILENIKYKTKLPDDIKPSIVKFNITLKNKIVSDNEIDFLLKMDRASFNNYLHYKIYSSEEAIGWSYRNIIDILYKEYDNRKIDYQDIAEKIKERAFEENIEKIAFSKNSVRGALNFIKSLSPPPIDENNVFKLRKFCDLHLLLWGLDYIYKKRWGEEYGSLMLLDEEFNEELCKFCLLKEEYLDSLLKDISFVYSDIVEINFKTFGKYVRLKRSWKFEDIL